MEKYFGKKDASTRESRVEQKRPRIELDMNDIVADPGLRKPIEDFSDYDCIKLRSDLLVFIDEVRNDQDFETRIDFGSLAEKMVQTDRHTHYPLVYRLIELALILPVATATVERTLSAMNIIKTERRNKMNDEWMNNSMICYIERELFASIEDDTILKRFQGLRTRKIQLPHEAPSIDRVGSSGVNLED